MYPITPRKLPLIGACRSGLRRVEGWNPEGILDRKELINYVYFWELHGFSDLCWLAHKHIERAEYMMGANPAFTRQLLSAQETFRNITAEHTTLSLPEDPVFPNIDRMIWDQPYSGFLAAILAWAAFWVATSHLPDFRRAMVGYLIDIAEQFYALPDQH